MKKLINLRYGDNIIWTSLFIASRITVCLFIKLKNSVLTKCTVLFCSYWIFAVSWRDLFGCSVGAKIQHGENFGWFYKGFGIANALEWDGRRLKDMTISAWNVEVLCRRVARHLLATQATEYNFWYTKTQRALRVKQLSGQAVVQMNALQYRRDLYGTRLTLRVILQHAWGFD